jgi:uncharacterized protein YndB with AHSA1/START domain
MTEGQDRSVASESDRDIVTTQIIHAPRERVFAAWTNPDQLALWWGPKGFANTIEVFDLRPGGHWRFVMHGPDGVDYRNESVFIEITPPERIIFDHVSGPHFQVTVTFAEEAGQTRLTFRMRFGTAAECEAIKRFALEGNEQTFNRLEALLTGA